ncbi:MAG: thiamine pyrophosphate-binding protein [Myxococcales bacterium]
MKVSDYVAEYLARRGVTHVFYLIGGMITHLVDSMHRRGSPRLVTLHHEQAAAFAADAWARMTGVPGVAMATSGPGATNLLTGIGSCYFDGTPAVFITGQVNRHELKGDRAIRQQGFQETDIVSMARPITKASWLVTDPAKVPTVLAEAFDLALEGRPGPVLIDLPMDVQRMNVEPVFPPKAPAAQPVEVDAEEILKDLSAARAPLLLVGGGVQCSGSVAAFRKVAEALGIPVVHSLQGVDLLPVEHPLRAGLIGTYGNRWANTALGLSDFLLVLGSRLDIRQTGSDAAGFAKGKRIHQVDVEAAEMNNRVKGVRAHHSALQPFLDALLRHLGARPALARREDWLREIARMRERWPDTQEQVALEGLNPNAVLHQVSARLRHASSYSVDVGNHQMWAAQSLDLGEGQRFLTSAGMGSMGFALPSAIGAAFARPDAPAVVVVGDGGLQCNIQELQTVARNKLDLKIVVLDNASLGMVRHFQESYFGKRLEGTEWGYSAPDFAKVAQAYGIPARTAGTEAELRQALDELFSHAGPALLHVLVSREAKGYPKLAFGKPITEMEPLAKPQEMEDS